MVDLIQKLLNLLFSLDVSSPSSGQQVSGNAPNFEDILKELIKTLKDSSANFDEIIKKILQSGEKDFSDSLQDLLQSLKKTENSETKEDEAGKSQDDLLTYPLHIILNFASEPQTKFQEGSINSDDVQSNQSQGSGENQKAFSIDGKQVITEFSIDDRAKKEEIKDINKQIQQTNREDKLLTEESSGEKRVEKDFFSTTQKSHTPLQQDNSSNNSEKVVKGEFQSKEDKLLTKEISSKNQEISQTHSNKSELLNPAESSGEKRVEKDFFSTTQKSHTPLQQDNSSNNIQDNKSNNINGIDYNSRSDSKIPELKQVILDSIKFVLNTHQKRAVMEADVLGSKVVIDVAVDNSNKLSLSITTPDTSLKADISKHQDDLRRFLEGNNFVLQRFDVNSGFDQNLNRENISHFKGFNLGQNLNHSFTDEEKFSRGTVFANIKGRFLAIV